jgi:predicted transcriptional regulator
VEEYRKILILLYLNEAKEDYSLIDISSKLGFEVFQCDSIIRDMLNEGLIEYKDYILTLSDYGKDIIINIKCYKYQKDNIGNSSLKFDFEKAKNIYDIYIPNNFLRKLK